MINVNPGETVNDLFVKEDEMYVHSTGVANTTIVDKDGWVYVSKGGILNNTFINKDGEVDLLSSGSANATQIMTDGALYVGGKAVAIGTIVEGGSLVVEEKGIASDTTVNGPGQMYVFSGGKTKGTTTVNDGGFLTLEWESIHPSAIIHGGKLTVLGGPADGDMAFLEGFNVDSGGSMTVSGSALVSSGTIADAWAKVTSDGILEKVTLNAATVEIKNGALLSNADMKTGTVVNIASGGVIRKLAVSKGAVLTGVLRDVSELHFDGGTLDLNISGIAPGGEFLIGDDAYTYISGSSYECTLTVDSSAQTAGVYELIEDATGFDKTITVKDTLGTTLGTLMLGGDPLVYGPLSYKLSIDTTGLLSVTVDAGGGIPDTTPPDKPIPEASSELPTNGYVTVTATFSDDSVIRECSKDGENWVEYQTSGLTFVENGKAYFRATDGAGNVSDIAVYEVTNIDKVAPTISYITPSTTAPAASVTVTASFDDDVSLASTQYRIGYGAWHDYDPAVGVTVTENTTVNFLATDTAGNTATDSYEVTNIGGGVDLTGDLSSAFNLTAGKYASSVNILEGGRLKVLNGGFASQTTVKTGGSMTVSSGGSADIVTVSGGGEFYVWSGGTATNIAWTPCEGIVYVGNGASATFVSTYTGVYYGSDGKMLENAAVMDGKILDENCEMWVMDGGLATNTTLNGCMQVFVRSGGSASGATIVNYGWIAVSSGGVADDITIVSGALGVQNGGSANAAKVGADGRLEVFSGGTATNIAWTPCEGEIYIENGGYATYANTYTGVYYGSDNKLLESAASMDGKTLDDNCIMYVMDGGLVTNTTVDGHGDVEIWSGGKAANATLNYGWLSVSSGGVAAGITVNGTGCVEVSGGVIDGAVFKTGCELVVYDEAKFTGRITFENGIFVENYGDLILDFDLTQTEPGAATLVNGLSFLPGGASAFTLTVDGSQLSGTYNLADGATGFDKTITVMSPLGEEYGTLAVGGSLSTAFADYTLNLSGAALTLDLVAKAPADTTPPVVENVAADITAPTNGNVTVTADFTDNVAVAYRWFRLDAGAWQDYPAGGVVVDCNTVIDFMAIDTSGNESDVVTCTVTNIDKEPPTITAITPSTTEPAASVTVTANFADDVALAFQQFKIGDGAWQDYTTGVTVTENGTIYFKAIDAAGNETTDSYEVTNIQTLEPDTTNPTVINVAADITAQTNGNVTVTAEFTDNVAVAYKYYTLSLYEMWQDYPDGGVVVTENNTTVYFEAVDTSGNVSEIVTFSVTNIDKEAPTITGITPSTTAPAASVTVTATFSDNVALAAQQYKIGGGAWQNYVDGVLVTENALVTFKAVDTAGNETTETYDVTNIEPTGSSITGDITGETKDVPAGWTALNVNVNTGGKLNVLDGGVASNTNVNAGGRLYVSSGGIARDTTVNDGGLIEGSGCEIDGIVVNSGGSLLLYSGAKLTGQMTFASGAEVIPFVGSILDFDLTQTEPGSPALVNDLSILMGTPTYTITVDNSQALGTYKLAGGAAGFDKPITVRSIYGEIGCTLTVDGGATKLGDVYLTLALSGSDLTFTISEDSGGGIIPDNKPDDGKNDYLYKKKADPEWNNANIHVTNEITGNGEVRLDLPGTIDTEDGKHNLFGHDKDNMDTGDVAQVEVNDPAKLTFTIDSNAAGTFYVYEDGFDKKGNRKMITVKKITVKAGKLATLKDVCLTSTGKYYVAMTAKNVKKVGTEGLYNVNVIESKFFVDADSGDNNEAKDNYLVWIGRGAESKPIILDSNSMKGSTEFKNFVGFTDGKDYTKLDLASSAYLKFNVTGNGDGKAKFTVWKQAVGTTGKLSKVTSVSLPAKKVYDATTKAQFLDTSKYTYYVSMECSDEAKGKGVYYNVQITDDAVFFDSDDDGKNNVLYDKKAKSFYVEDANHHFESTTIGTETKVKLDTDPVADTDWENFVGYQDPADYAKIKLTSDGKLNFHLEASGDATFTVYKKGQDKKGNDTLETIQAAKIALAKGASKTEKDIQISDLEAGEYYVSMAAKSTKANDKGSVFYNVTASLDVPLTSALEMPMAAASYADSVQDKLLGETGSGLLASL